MNMTPPFFRAPRSILLTSIALLSPFLIVPANAGVIWDGGGADDNWGTGANWSPDGPPPVGPTVDLTFDGTTRLTPFNNYTAFDDFHSLFFAATAGQFNVGGNAIDLFGKIENYSTVTQTVSLASLAINAGQAGTGEFNPVNGDLLINSANVFTNGNALHVYGGNNRTVTFGAGTVISQGGSFAIEQANTVVFQSAHTYTGDTLVNAGTLVFATGGSVNGSIIRIGGTATNSGAATVSLTATAGGQTLASTLVVRPSASGSQGVRTIASQNTSGTNTLSGGVFLDADLTTSATAGGTLAFTGGTFDLKNQTLTVGGSGNTSISGALQNSTGSGKLTKTGNGTLTLGGANSFTGALTVAEGTLSTANWNNSSTNGPLGNSTLPVTLGSATTQGTLRFTGGGSNNVPATIKPLSLAAGGGKVEMVYSAGNRGGNFIHINGDRITGSGGLTVDTFAGGATSRFIVVGSAPYTGPTVVAAGSELQTNYDVAGDGTPFGSGANGLGSAVTVNAGGLLTFFSFNNTRTIALGSLAGGGTVQGEGGGTHTFKIGGDDTSTAFSGIFQNNGGPVAVTKVGTGTLTLSGANSHTGLMTINGGAVSVPSWNLSGAAGPWGAVANNTGAPATTFIQMNGGRINYTGPSATGNLRGVNLASGNNTIDIITGSTLNFAGGGFNTFQSNGGNLTKEGGGTLQLGTDGIANNIFTGKVTLNAGTLEWFGGGSMPSPAAPVADFITINNGATFQLSFGGGSTVNANVGFKVVGTAGFSIPAATHTIPGVISDGASAGGITKSGNGVLALTGANTYSGATTISGGTLTLSGAGAIADTSAVNVSGATSVLNISGITASDETVGSLAGVSGSSVVLGAKALTVGGDNTSTVFAGVLSGGGGNLTKIGNGALTLSGANSHNGLVTINGGGISVPSWNLSGVAGPWGTAGNNPGAAATTFIQMNGGRINYTGATASGDLRGVNLVSGNNTIDVITGSTLNFAGGFNRFQSNGGNLIKEGGGTLQIGTFGVALVPDFITINSGGKFQLTYPDVPTTVSANVGFNVSGNTGLHSVGSHTIPGIIANGASAGSITKTGNGTFTLTGVNTYTGSLTVEEGTLNTNGWNNNGTDGPLGNSNSPVTLGSATAMGTLRYFGPQFLPDSGKKGLFLNPGGGKVQLAIGAGRAFAHLDGSSINGSGGLTVETAGARFLIVGSAGYTGPTVVEANSELQANYYNSGVDGTPFGAGLNGLGSPVTLSGNGLLTLYSAGASTTVAIGSLSGSGTVRGEAAGVHTLKVGGDNTNTEFSGAIADSFDSGTGPTALTKVGAGTLVLSGVNTNTGATRITSGTLLVSGSISGSTVTVDGGTLGGSGGTVGATTVNSGGTFAPGTSIGTLNVSGTLALGGTAAFELNKSGFTLSSDLASVTGALTLGGTLNVTATGNTLTPGDSFNLFDAASFAGSFATLNLPSLTLDYTWDTSALATDGSIAVVPEPGAVISLLSGLGILAAFRRRRA